jgi:hypothetical protein
VYLISYHTKREKKVTTSLLFEHCTAYIFGSRIVLPIICATTTGVGKKSRRLILKGNTARVRQMRNKYKLTVEKCERKKPYGIHSRRWGHKTKVDMIGIEREFSYFIQLSQNVPYWRILQISCTYISD